MNPRSKADFDTFEEMLKDKISQYEVGKAACQIYLHHI